MSAKIRLSSESFNRKTSFLCLYNPDGFPLFRRQKPFPCSGICFGMTSMLHEGLMENSVGNFAFVSLAQHSPQVWPLRSLNETFKLWNLLSGIQKHRTSLMKTSVLLKQNIRTLYQRSPMFCTFRTATSHSPFPPPTKKVFENLLHFLHHGAGCPVFTNDFG